MVYGLKFLPVPGDTWVMFVAVHPVESPVSWDLPPESVAAFSECASPP